MSKIYLLHQTDINYIDDILETKNIYPSSKTKNKKQNPYKINLPYIFMSCCHKNDFNILFPYTFIFEIDILLDRCFYICDRHTAGNIKSDNCSYFTKNSPIEDINNSLQYLYKESKKIVNSFQINLKGVFVVFQEIFFKKKVNLNLNHAKYIILPKNVNINLLNKIKTNYPKLKIIY
jgi:hypothetical protein